jgi:hypothetical protein
MLRWFQLTIFSDLFERTVPPHAKQFQFPGTAQLTALASPCQDYFKLVDQKADTRRAPRTIPDQSSQTFFQRLPLDFKRRRG